MMRYKDDYTFKRPQLTTRTDMSSDMFEQENIELTFVLRDRYAQYQQRERNALIHDDTINAKLIYNRVMHLVWPVFVHLIFYSYTRP